MFNEAYDNNQYISLNAIYSLFKEKNFNYNIGSKTTNDSLSQTLIYSNPINKTEKYVINILNNNNIITEVPLKNTNYYFKSKHTNISNVYNYMKLHIT